MDRRLIAVLVLSACSGGSGGNTGGGSATGGGGGSGRREYPKRVHVALTLNASTTINDSSGNLTTEKRWVGTFEGNSSASRISGVNMVYEFENSIDQFSGASVFTKAYRGAGGGYDERTDTVTAVTGSSFSVTVGPSSFNAQTGELFGPFSGVSVDIASSGVTATAGATRVDFSANIPAKLDSRCAPDTKVSQTGGLALDGDVYAGYVIRQSYTCTAGTTTFRYESSAQLTAL